MNQILSSSLITLSLAMASVNLYANDKVVQRDTSKVTHIQEIRNATIKDDCLDRRQFESFLAQYEQIRANQDTAELNIAMQQANPVYILRNHMAQKAIELAERNDFSEVERLFDLLSQPFERNVTLEKAEDLAPLPTDVPEVMVSCSS